MTTEHYRCPECGFMFQFERDGRSNALHYADGLPPTCKVSPKRYWAFCVHIRHAVVKSPLKDLPTGKGA